MSVAIQSAPDSSRIVAVSALQQLLPEFVGLTLHAKQAHWNITGPAFLPLHALTDEMATDTRNWTDRLAERSLALGFAVDARPGTVASVAGEFPAGRITDREAVFELVELIAGVAALARALLADVERADVVTHGITVEILEGLEKYYWMLDAQRQ